MIAIRTMRGEGPTAAGEGGHAPLKRATPGPAN
jgi:hypothetical protein